MHQATWPTITQGQQGKPGAKNGIALQPAAVGVDPRTIGLLAAGQFGDQLSPPRVLRAVGVNKLIFWPIAIPRFAAAT